MNFGKNNLEMKSIGTIDLGILSFEETYILQKKILEKKRCGTRDDYLIFVEHPNIFTIGRTGSEKNILVNRDFLNRNGIKVIKTDRGGDVTFHGIGQLVCYPIFDLRNHFKDLGLFIEKLECVLGLALSDFGIDAVRDGEFTGIWAGGEKIGFIGIGVSSWITFHGISINANVDLKYFSMIRPCGIDGLKVGSMQNILKARVDIGFLKNSIYKKFCEVFGFDNSSLYSENAFLAQEETAGL